MIDVEISMRDSENQELARLTRSGDTSEFVGRCVISGKAVRFVVIEDGEEWTQKEVVASHVWMSPGSTILLKFEKDSCLAGLQDSEEPSYPTTDDEDNESLFTRDVLLDEIDEDPLAEDFTVTVGAFDDGPVQDPHALDAIGNRIFGSVFGWGGGGGGSGAVYGSTYMSIGAGGAGGAGSSGLQEVDGEGYACGGRNDSRPAQQAPTEKPFDFDEYNNGIKRR